MNERENRYEQDYEIFRGHIFVKMRQVQELEVGNAPFVEFLGRFLASRIWGLGFAVRGVGCGVWGVGYGVRGLECGV